MSAADDWFRARGWTPFPFQHEAWAAYLAGRDGLGGEAGVEQGPDARGGRQGGEAAQQAGQHPVGVHAGMPVEAAEEHRMRLPWQAQVVRPRENVVVLVGEGPRHMAECDAGKAAGGVLGQFHSRKAPT